MSDADFDHAVAQAAKLLRESKAPVIAGLGADSAGIVAAFRLAEKLGAAIDHSGAEWILRDQAVMQDVGLMVASPGEILRRADTILVVGDRPFEAWPEFSDLLFPKNMHRAPVPDRRAVALTSRALEIGDGRVASWLKVDAVELPKILAALRARVNARPLAQGFDRRTEVEAATGILKAAKFGVALWSPEEVDALTIEMLAGLVKDLNAATRWSGLSVGSDLSATAAAMASGWMTGLPLRISFARGRPEHDLWQHDAKRLVEAGEADAIVWIGVFDDPLPDWLSAVPAVVLGRPAVANPRSKATVSIPVGRPGRDHDGIVYDRATGTLVETAAQLPSALASAADILNRLADTVSPP